MALLNPTGDRHAFATMIRLLARWLRPHAAYRHGNGDLTQLNAGQLRDLALTRRELRKAGIRLDTWPFGI